MMAIFEWLRYNARSLNECLLNECFIRSWMNIWKLHTSTGAELKATTRSVRQKRHFPALQWGSKKRGIRINYDSDYHYHPLVAKVARDIKSSWLTGGPGVARKDRRCSRNGWVKSDRTTEVIWSHKVGVDISQTQFLNLSNDLGGPVWPHQVTHFWGCWATFLAENGNFWPQGATSSDLWGQVWPVCNLPWVNKQLHAKFGPDPWSSLTMHRGQTNIQTVFFLHAY